MSGHQNALLYGAEIRRMLISINQLLRTIRESLSESAQARSVDIDRGGFSDTLLAEVLRRNLRQFKSNKTRSCCQR